MAFFYDDSRLPLFVVRSDGEATDAEFDAYLAHMSRILTRAARYAVLFDARGAARPTPRQRQKQADWMKQHASSLRQHNVGIAFVIESAIVRGALTAILWLSPMAAPHKVVATPEQAERWLSELLAAEGLKIPPAAA